MLPKVIIIMGVAGAGKTTVGTALAARLGARFADADSFHSDANREKMSSGIPLSDEDRQPWLNAMRVAVSNWLLSQDIWVLACSALKDNYRQILQVDPERVQFVYLQATPGLIKARLEARHHHYMRADMADSQFATFEAPDPAKVIFVDADASPSRIVDQICYALTDRRQA